MLVFGFVCLFSKYSNGVDVMVNQESPTIKKDTYEEFIELIERGRVSRERFIAFGLNHIYKVDDEVALSELEKAIEALNTKKNTHLLTIRRYGRKGDNPYLELYKKIFKIKLMQDSDNNKRPVEIMKNHFGMFKSQHYQCAHVWGMTKNPIMFTALFNIVLIPRMFDPFTDNNAKGRLHEEFLQRFRKHVKGHFKKSIQRYNNYLVKYKIEAKIDRFYHECGAKDIEEFHRRAMNEWQQI